MFQSSTVLERFIVIEGVDGAGTSTQRQLLCKSIKSLGQTVYEEFEPTDSHVGKLIRKVLSKELSMQAQTLALLFAADRFEHHAGPSGITENCKKGNYVVSDRYVFSSLAYQGVYMDLEWIETINQGCPLPHYLFFIDVDLVTSKKRRSGRGEPEELFDDDPIQLRVRENYLKTIRQIAAAHPHMNLHMISGDQSIEAIHFEIWKILGFPPIH